MWKVFLFHIFVCIMLNATMFSPHTITLPLQMNIDTYPHLTYSLVILMMCSESGLSALGKQFSASLRGMRSPVSKLSTVTCFKISCSEDSTITLYSHGLPFIIQFLGYVYSASLFSLSNACVA